MPEGARTALAVLTILTCGLGGIFWIAAEIAMLVWDAMDKPIIIGYPAPEFIYTEPTTPTDEDTNEWTYREWKKYGQV